MIYLDYAATTPVDPRVIEKMLSYLGQEGHFGNSSSNHMFGRQAARAIENAKQQVAASINTNPEGIIWTSGATEAINLALKGAAHYYRAKGQHIVTCMSEHSAAFDACKSLEEEGFSVTYLQPENNGLLDLAKLEKALRDDTILLSVMQVNNEIGVVQDIAAIGELARSKDIVFHVDGAQSAGKLPIDLAKLPVDLMSFSAHKVYGPKGIGALYVRSSIHIQPQIHGGGHQKGLRSGTLPTHQIVGMGEAFALAQQEMAQEVPRIQQLRERLWSGIQQVGGVHLNSGDAPCVANILNVSFEKVESGNLLPALRDLAISVGSACHASSPEPSRVLKSIGLSNELVRGAIRLSLGRFTTEAEIDSAVAQIQKTVTFLRKL